MKQREQEFLMRLAERALPGSTRLVRAMGSLDKRIDDLEKKVACLDDSVDEQVSRLERGIDTLGESSKRRPTEPDETSESGPT
jgi:uncharacterized protein with von Willebrand factor type A (vWA) domain